MGLPEIGPSVKQGYRHTINREIPVPLTTWTSLAESVTHPLKRRKRIVGLLLGLAKSPNMRVAPISFEKSVFGMRRSISDGSCQLKHLFLGEF